MIRVALLGALLLALTACASTPNPLDAKARQALFVKDAEIAWSYDDAKNNDKPEYVAGKTEFTSKLETAVEQAFKVSPAGADPVKFVVDVKRYSRVGAAMGNIIGGSNMVTADVKVVRLADGSQVGVYKGVTGLFASNGGLLGAVVQGITKPDVEGVMANSFAQNLRARFDAKK